MNNRIRTQSEPCRAATLFSLRPGSTPRPSDDNPTRVNSAQACLPPSSKPWPTLYRWILAAYGLALTHCLTWGAPFPATLPGTNPLSLGGDIASNLVAGVDQFLLRRIVQAQSDRERFWKRDLSSSEAYSASLTPNRKELERILGVRDARVSFDGFELVRTLKQDSKLAQTDSIEVHEIRWPVLDGVSGEGLLLTPKQSPPKAFVVAVPDADMPPEAFVGLSSGPKLESQFARRLAEAGCLVIVPSLINRTMGEAKVTHSERGKGLSNREFLYRPSFELGRHLIGFEIQKVLAAVDQFTREAGANAPIGVAGWGEGGAIALYASALDTRIKVAAVSGFFDNRNNLWQQPIDRNVFGLLERFGDAELAAMVPPRSLIIETARSPVLSLDGRGGGAPADLKSIDPASARTEFERAKALVAGLKIPASLELFMSGDGVGEPFSTPVQHSFLNRLGIPMVTNADRSAALVATRSLPDPSLRNKRQMREIDQFTQRLLTDSPFVRQEFMKRLDTSSPEKFAETSRWYRDYFANEVIGRFELPVRPANPRTRKVYEEESWIGYEVVLDVYEDVIAYGLLLLPRDIKPDERRPVVVCQHGLEGRPQDTIGKAGFQAYSAFSAKLAARGFIVFAPQNLYLFTDRFRSLQRKANPLKKTLFSIITPQHQQIVDWLQAQPFVDPARIAFYGLSYGGKTAMRVPALVTDYCLSICSADFNEWVWKNASTRSPYSYVWSGEYEIFEFDLGSTFNYAEMATLIAPRPFMVERGHFDGVAPDETVAHEFAKVRNLYSARLKLKEQAIIEWFVGPHTINGQGTFDFLHKHLNWPAPAQPR